MRDEVRSMYRVKKTQNDEEKKKTVIIKTTKVAAGKILFTF